MDTRKITISLILVMQLLVSCKNKSQPQSDLNDRTSIISLYDNGVFDKSLQQAIDYSKTHLNDTLITLIIASCYEETGEYLKSKQAYTDAYHLGYLSKSDYYGYMGILSRSLKDYKSAFSFYDSVLYQSPMDYKILLSRALTYEDLGLIKEAINDCRTLIKLDSSNKIKALSNIGTIYMDINKLDSAYPYLREAAMNEPNSITAFNLSNYFRLSQKNDSALLYYNKAVEFSPNNPFYVFERGNYLYTTKQEKKACEDWNKAAELGYPKAQQRVKEYCR